MNIRNQYKKFAILTHDDFDGYACGALMRAYLRDNALAESIEKLQLKKGTMLYVEGKIRNRTYDDKEGHKKSYTEINADSITVIKRPAVTENGIANEIKSAPVPDGPVMPGDLPF